MCSLAASGFRVKAARLKMDTAIDAEPDLRRDAMAAARDRLFPVQSARLSLAGSGQGRR